MSRIQPRSRLQPAASPPLHKAGEPPDLGHGPDSISKVHCSGLPVPQPVQQNRTRSCQHSLLQIPGPPPDLGDERGGTLRPPPTLPERHREDCFRPTPCLQPSGEHLTTTDPTPRPRPYQTSMSTPSERQRGSCQSLGSRELSPHTCWPSAPQALSLLLRLQAAWGPPVSAYVPKPRRLADPFLGQALDPRDQLVLHKITLGPDPWIHRQEASRPCPVGVFQTQAEHRRRPPHLRWLQMREAGRRQNGWGAEPSGAQRRGPTIARPRPHL